MTRSRAIRSVLGAAAIAAAALLVAYLGVAASLPRRAGVAQIAGLGAPVAVTLDARAIPTARGESFVDVLRAQGYLHAQERFFQMDLLRRSAAGELAALVGERALPADRAQKAFGYRALAGTLLDETLPAEHAAWLRAYAEGVNAGLEDLGARPPEYWLLGAAPKPWTAEDSVLAALTLSTMLSNNDAYERAQGVMHATLPSELYAFLTPSSSRYDRPVVGATAEDPTGGYVPLPIPPPTAVDLRAQTAPEYRDSPRVDPPLLGPASNQWAVDGTRGVGGRALLANDPHLRLSLPNVFYRTELEWPGGALRGVSIPGLPGVLIGASDEVAWGATVSNADQSDWVVIEVDPDDSSRYRTPEGYESFREVAADIEVAGRAPERLVTRHTRYGPVVAADWQGRPLALHATWAQPGGVNLAVLELGTARNVAEAAAVLARWAGPSLNWMLADRAGEIGWVVNGPLPRRVGFDGSRPESLADGSRRWEGWLEPPRRAGSAEGALFTANSRTLEADEAATLSRMWMRPLRAKRIADLLSPGKVLDEPGALAMQLDTRAEGYEALRAAVLEVIASDETEPLLARSRAHAAAWNGHADVDQPGFRLLHAYYRALLERALTPMLAPAIAADRDFVYRWPLADETLRRLLDERPVHLLTREYPDWSAFLREVLHDTLAEIERDSERPGIDAPWGEANALAVGHVFAGLGALAPLRPWLRLPTVPLPGSTLSLRVAAPDYGAVLRLAVAPGRLESGILQLAGGQSGHFLSPQFRDQSADWLAGTPTPFLAGPEVSRIRLTPQR
jgi:penicillin amidase